MKAKTGQFMMAAALVSMALLAQAQAGQTRGAAPAAAAPAPATPAAGAAATPAQRAGAPRRDPFRPLVQQTRPDALPARLPAGKPGLVIGQLIIQGIVRGIDGKWMAVVDNKTKRSYFLYERDELYNGVVTRITADTVTFEERSVDGSGRTLSREVVKRIGG